MTDPVLQAEKVTPVIVGSDGPGANGGAPNPGGILAREERRAADAVRAALGSLGLDLGSRPLELRPIPFEGTWGVATMVARMIASDAVQKDLEASGALVDLSKKEAKRLVNEAVGPKAVEIAGGIAAAILATPEHGFAAVEAVNGYVNISFDAGQMAAQLIDQVTREGADYGKGAPKAERVMVEHSQPNTHKAFHVGHLRNSVSGSPSATSCAPPATRCCTPTTSATSACTSSSASGATSASTGAKSRPMPPRRAAGWAGSTPSRTRG